MLFFKKRKCNHSVDDENTTLVKSKKKCMIDPLVEEFYCHVCHKFFSFTRK